MITEEIKRALERDVDLSREEYAEKSAKADEVTAKHGVEGEAPLTEEERERRMRMNYYGTMINIGMALLAAIDDVGNAVKTLNNNILAMGGVSGAESDT